MGIMTEKVFLALGSDAAFTEGNRTSSSPLFP